MLMSSTVGWNMQHIHHLWGYTDCIKIKNKIVNKLK